MTPRPVGDCEGEGLPLIARLSSDHRLAEARLARRLKRYPYFSVVESASGPRTQINGRQVINLGSNNYLGLANDPEVVEGAVGATRRWGAGVTGSRFLNGNLRLHEELEAELAAFVGMEAAIVLPTGYSTNLGLLSGLLRRSDFVAVDAEAHASILDGALLSRATLKRFRHNDWRHLEDLLSQSQRPSACVVEGVYSMRGDAAPLLEIARVCSGRRTAMIVDEAHSFGVIGPGGRGLCAREALLDAVDFVTITFSKSLASCGGAILGSTDAIEALRISMRPFMFTASNTPASLGAARAALNVLRREPERTERVQAAAKQLCRLVSEHGVPVSQSDSPILTIPVGNDFKTLQAWKMLWNRGVFCNPVLSPAVPAGEGLLRLSVMATHSDADLAEAADCIASILPLLDTTAQENSKSIPALAAEVR